MFFGDLLNIFFLIIFRKLHIHCVSRDGHSHPFGYSWLASRYEVLLHSLLDCLRPPEAGRSPGVHQPQPAQVQQPSHQHPGAESRLPGGGVQPQGGRGGREQDRRLGELLPQHVELHARNGTLWRHHHGHPGEQQK